MLLNELSYPCICDLLGDFDEDVFNAYQSTLVNSLQLFEARLWIDESHAHPNQKNQGFSLDSSDSYVLL